MESCCSCVHKWSTNVFNSTSTIAAVGLLTSPSFSKDTQSTSKHTPVQEYLCQKFFNLFISMLDLFRHQQNVILQA